MKHGICTEWAEDGRLTKDITYNYDAPVSEYLVIYHGDGYTEMNRRNGEYLVLGSVGFKWKEK